MITSDNVACLTGCTANGGQNEGDGEREEKEERWTGKAIAAEQQIIGHTKRLVSEVDDACVRAWV